MQLQFVGSGDAFGSGGRLNTCFHVIGSEANFLIDCGASAMVGLNRLGVDVNAIDTVLLTHFHGDHFGGVPFFILHADLVAKRTRPLVLAGPPGLPARYANVMDVLFPSFPHRPARFPLELVEIEVERPCQIGSLHVTAYPVVHTEAAGPCFGYRIAVEGRIVAYSGDTEWTEALVNIGRDADLFICECYTRERLVPGHINLAVLRQHLDRIRPKKMVLTHMSADMLDRLNEIDIATAKDEITITF